MATLQLINNLGVNVDIPDVGIVIPPTGDVFTDPEFLRTLVVSQDLRNRLVAEDLTANDGVNNLPIEEALVYLSLLWTRGGRDEITGVRVLASGQTTIAALTTVTLATMTRFPTDRLSFHLYLLDDVNGANFSPGFSFLGIDSVRAYFERTATPNQVLFKASNAHLTQNRTIDWTVLAVRA
ncbi:MAG: hypothetical protein MN733_05525 [Nitrososphaera sp.]|nr:hypothetical protein [Nitrososphaera sp.]